MTDRTVSVSLVARVQGFTAGISSAAKATREFGGEMETLRKRNAAGMHDIQLGAAAAGAALVGLAGWAVKAAMDFDAQMSKVGAVANASAGQLDNLRKAALSAGKATVFSATEAAQAEEELAKAGLSAAQITGGALTGALNLAAAGSIGLAEAADIAAKSMNVWQLGAGQVGHIADVLASSANKSATDVHEMGEAIRMGGLAAKSAGLSLEDTAGVLSAFADRALIGSDAGTSLKTMLMMLSNPSDGAAATMKELGIQVYDASGKFVGAERLAGILQQRLSGLTQQERQAALARIFGSDATRAATVLYELGATGIHNYITAVNDSGAAARTAAEKTDNLAGDIERLKGNIETLTIQSGEGANGGLRFLTQALDHLVSSVSGIPGPVQTGIVVFAGITGAALLAAAAMLKVRGATRNALDAMREAGPVGTKFAGALGTVGKFAGRATLLLGGLQLGGSLLSTAMSSVTLHLGETTAALEALGTAGTTADAVSKILSKDLGRVTDDIKMVTAAGGLAGAQNAAQMESFFGLSGFSFSNAAKLDELKQVDAQLAQLVQSGHGAAASAMFKDIGDAARAADSHVGDITALFPQYSAAATGAATATDTAGKATKDAADNTKTLGLSLEEAIKQAGSLSAVWDQLTGKMRTSDEAMLEATEAIDTVKKAFKENGTAIEGNSLAALRNRVAMEKSAKAAVDAAQAYYNQTGDLAGARAMLKRFEDSNVDAAGATGKARKAVQKFADTLYQLPKNPTVTLTLIERLIKADTGKGGTHHDYADGGISYYAAGGTRENHVAQIAPGGSWRVWGEPETEGESYIPLAASKRGRSTAVLAQTNALMGNPLGVGAMPSVSVAPAFDVMVYLGNEQLAGATVKIIQRSPETVALANREGEKRLAFA